MQLNPGNSNCQLLRVIGVLRYRRFAQKDQKHLIDYRLHALFLFAGKNCKNCLFTNLQMCDIEKGQFVIIYIRD